MKKWAATAAFKQMPNYAGKPLPVILGLVKSFIEGIIVLLDILAILRRKIAEQVSSIARIYYKKRYNPDKDIPFSSFTSTFIRHRLSRVVASQYGAKVPVHIQEIISAIDRINSSRLNAQGSPMADDEIVEQFKVRPGGPDHNYVTVGAIRQAMLLTRYIGSIDNGYSPHTDDSPGNAYVLDDAQQLHSVTSEIAPLPEEEVEANILRESLEKLLSTLDRRKADILRMRFGFDGLPPKTLEQVAQVFGVTRDRVRQIEARTLADLRLKKCKELIDYLEK